MARLRALTRVTSNSSPHPTEVDAEWDVIHSADSDFLQIATFGSEQRASNKKVSQTIQIDRAIAIELKKAIESTFPGI